MVYEFDKYEFIFIDSAFFNNRFEFSFVSAIRNSENVCISNTFFDEVEAYKSVIPNAKLSIYEQNLREINHVISNIKLNVSDPYLMDDIFNLSRAVALNSNVLVVTENQLLIDRLILNKAKLDILDLYNKQYFKFSNQNAEFEKRNKLDKDKYVDCPNIEYDINEGTSLKTIGNDSYVMEKELGEGKEAKVFKTKNGTMVAKIFSGESFTRAKQRNVQNLINKIGELDVDWLSIPTDILYLGDYIYGMKPVGLVERFINTASKPFSEESLYVGDFEYPEDFNYTIKSNLETCIRFISQIMFLNSHGIYLCDYNKTNFAHSTNRKSIQMWDTDSFCFGAYFANCFDGDAIIIITPEDYETKQNAITLSNELLYIFIYELLSLGFQPFYAIDEQNVNYRGKSPYWDNFYSKELWEVLNEIFTQKNRPSIPHLLRILKHELNSLKADKTYTELCSALESEKKNDADSEILNQTKSNQKLTKPVKNSPNPFSKPELTKKEKTKKIFKKLFQILYWGALIGYSVYELIDYFL